MAALIGVRPRTAPVLLEEHPEPDLGAREVVFGVQTPQNFVLGDQLLKARHDRMERVGAADSGVEGLVWLFHRLHCGPWPERAAERRMNLGRGCGYRLFTGLTRGHPAIW